MVRPIRIDRWAVEHALGHDRGLDSTRVLDVNEQHSFSCTRWLLLQFVQKDVGNASPVNVLRLILVWCSQRNGTEYCIVCVCFFLCWDVHERSSGVDVAPVHRWSELIVSASLVVVVVRCRRCCQLCTPLFICLWRRTSMTKVAVIKNFLIVVSYVEWNYSRVVNWTVTF